METERHDRRFARLGAQARPAVPGRCGNVKRGSVIVVTVLRFLSLKFPTNRRDFAGIAFASAAVLRRSVKRRMPCWGSRVDEAVGAPLTRCPFAFQQRY